MKKALAFDLGASGGRGIVGCYDGERLSLSEVHRFTNDPVLLRGTLYWDVLRLFYEIKQGIMEAGNTGHGDVSSIGVDTWGVDFGLIDRDGRLLENPTHYRDSRTAGMLEELLGIFSRRELYEITGIQFMEINTLYQMHYLNSRRPDLLERANRLLFMPDLFTYFLTGEMLTEYTIASTSQLLNVHKRSWDSGLMSRLGFPERLFCDVINPGIRAGTLTPSVREELGVGPIGVTVTTGHDTGAAFAAAPMVAGENSAVISCGTWSLLGGEFDSPVVSEHSQEFDFSNEGGYGGSIRLLKNITGFWILQECRRQWRREGKPVAYDELKAQARNARPFTCLIDPNDPAFTGRSDMADTIAAYAVRAGQVPPQSVGETVRTILESLALKYRYHLEQFETVRGRRVELVRIIGGGAQNELFCQFVANAVGRPVYAGPVEATALGNIAVQFISSGELANLAQARECIRESFPVGVFEPRDVDEWQDAYERFLRVV